MKISRKSLLLVVAALLAPSPAVAFAQSVEARPQQPTAQEKGAQEKAPTSPVHAFLWKIEKEGVATPSYLFGTMHVPDKRFLKFNPTVKQVFKNADAVYTELPMDNLAAMASEMQKLAFLTDGKKVTDFLDQETQDGLNVVLGDFGLNVEMFATYRPFMLGLTLEQLRMQQKYSGGKALDEQIYNAAKKAGKETGGVETLDEQLDALAVLTDEEYGQTMLKSVRIQLKDREQGRDRLGEMADLYLRGDEEALWKFVMEDFDPKDPLEVKSMNALLADRNVTMAKRLGERVLANPKKSHVFVFGCLHFLGPQSVNAHLEKAGFKVTRMTAPPKRARAAGLRPADPRR